MYENFKDESFKVGEDDKGKKIRIKLKYYLEYLVNQVFYLNLERRLASISFRK